MPAEASANEIRVQRGGHFPNAKDRAGVLEDDHDAHAAEDVAVVARLDGGLGHADEVRQIGGFFFVLELREVDAKRFGPRAVVPDVQHEIQEVQRQRLTVKEVASVG